MDACQPKTRAGDSPTTKDCLQMKGIKFTVHGSRFTVYPFSKILFTSRDLAGPLAYTTKDTIGP
jgi:hypothetical protein